MKDTRTGNEITSFYSSSISTRPSEPCTTRPSLSSAVTRGPRGLFIASHPGFLLLCFEYEGDAGRDFALRVGPGGPIPVPTHSLLPQGGVGTSDTPSLCIEVNFSSHSSIWNRSNPSCSFLGLSSEVETLTAFDPQDIRVRKLTHHVAFSTRSF